MEENIWEKFLMPEGAHPEGSGIMYFLRYSKGRIDAHRDQVKDALELRGVYLEDLSEEIGVSSKDVIENKTPVIHLLEELSALNEAKEYVDVFGEHNSLRDLSDIYMTKTFDLLKKENLPYAYHLVDSEIPRFVRELKAAETLTFSERQIMYSLISFAQNKVEQLNSPGGLVLIST